MIAGDTYKTEEGEDAQILNESCHLDNLFFVQHENERGWMDKQENAPAAVVNKSLAHLSRAARGAPPSRALIPIAL
jgi:hypothetical protein